MSVVLVARAAKTTDISKASILVGWGIWDYEVHG
jgi:hypothetical protein